MHEAALAVASGGLISKKCKWEAARKDNCQSMLAVLDIRLHITLTHKKDKNNNSQQGAGAGAIIFYCC